MRTPLAVVAGYADLLVRQFERESPNRERVAMLLDELRHGIDRLEALTEDLLVASSVHHSGDPLHFAPVDLVELVESVVQRFDIQTLTGRKHRFSVDAPDCLIGEWNAELLDRAVTNLVANAVKYSP